jgi:hypothetical protein
MMSERDTETNATGRPAPHDFDGRRRGEDEDLRIPVGWLSLAADGFEDADDEDEEPCCAAARSWGGNAYQALLLF